VFWQNHPSSIENLGRLLVIGNATLKVAVQIFCMEALKTKTFLERRSEKREHVGGTYLVKLDPGKGVPPFTCFVWDISESGIRLKLSERANLPPVVHILIGNVRKAAKVIWQKGDQVGLQFVAN
jgi:hypothetical protein